MTRQRRNRDDTGGSIYYDIDELTVGAGVFDIMKNVTTNVASKLTGKAAKKIAEKAAEKLVEKGAEKVGEKTGQLLGEKIYDRFREASPRKGELEGPAPRKENKGDQIIKELQKINNRGASPSKPNHKAELEGLSPRSISQQFNDLLNLF